MSTQIIQRGLLIMTIKIMYYTNESKTIGGVVAIDFDGETGEISIQIDNHQFLKYKMVKEVQVSE